jgi:hypothetical protein
MGGSQDSADQRRMRTRFDKVSDPFAVRASRIAGKAVISFGIGSLLASVVTRFFTDAFRYDLFDVILIFLGLSIHRGSRFATRWGFGLMVAGGLFGILAAVGATLGWKNLTIMGRTPDDTNAYWLAPVAFFLSCVCFAIMWLCWRSLRVWRRIERFECAACGFGLGASPVCTECGHDLAHQRE